MSAPSFDEHHPVEPHGEEPAESENDLDRPLATDARHSAVNGAVPAPHDEGSSHRIGGADQPAHGRGRSWTPWDKIHMAMPHLMGLPAYGRPARNYEPEHRPFDPDALPLEAERDPDDVADPAAAESREGSEAAHSTNGSVPAADLLRGITSRLRRPN